MLPEIDQRNLAAFFFSALRGPIAFETGIYLLRIPKCFAKDGFLSLDLATNSLVNQINSFYFYAIKRIVQ